MAASSTFKKLSSSKKIGLTPGAAWYTSMSSPNIRGSVNAPGVKKPPPAPAAPAAPTLPFNEPRGPQPSPWDSIYERQKVDLQNRWQDYSGAGGRYDQQRAALTSSFGINQQGLIDPSNPFSRAALLKESYQKSLTGDSNSFAARGLRNSGAFQNAVNSRTNSYNQNQNALSLDAQNAWNQLAQERLGEQRAYEGGLSSAENERIVNAANNPPADPGPTFGELVKPFQKAGYKIDMRPQNDAKGNFIFIRQPNTKKLFKLYTNGNKEAVK